MRTLVRRRDEVVAAVAHGVQRKAQVLDVPIRHGLGVLGADAHVVKAEHLHDLFSPFVRRLGGFLPFLFFLPVLPSASRGTGLASSVYPDSFSSSTAKSTRRVDMSTAVTTTRMGSPRR